MATEYPADPIKSGETAKFRAHPAARPRTLRAIGADHWLTDIENFVQSELRRVDGGFPADDKRGCISDIRLPDLARGHDPRFVT